MLSGLSSPRSRATSKALPSVNTSRSRLAAEMHEVKKAEFSRSASQLALSEESTGPRFHTEGEDDGPLDKAARDMLRPDTTTKEAAADASRTLKQAAAADTNLSSLTFQTRPLEAEVAAVVKAVSELHVLPTVSKFDQIAENDFLLSRAYLQDSAHCRSLNHGRSPHALEAYFRQHDKWWKRFLSLVAWLHICLGFIEPPSSIKFQGVPYGPSHAACGAIELVFLSVYAVQIFLQIRSYDQSILTLHNGYWRSKWRMCKPVILLACFIDVLVSMGRNETTTTSGIHASQLLRVIFVIEQSGRIRQLSTCILHSMPVILSVMWLILVHCLTFAMIGFVALGPLEDPSDENPDASRYYFDTIEKSIVSCVVLVTSENFPDVMLPSYRHHWFVCIFFVVFLVIGLYGLIQVTVAVVFHSFRAHTRTKLATALVYQEAGLQKAYETLARTPLVDPTTPHSGSISSPADGAVTSASSMAPLISRDSWHKLMRLQRPQWTQQQADRIFDTARTAKDEWNEEEIEDLEEANEEGGGAQEPHSQYEPSLTTQTQYSLARYPHQLTGAPAAASSSSPPRPSSASRPVPFDGLNFDQFDHAVAIAQFDEFPFPPDSRSTNSLRVAPPEVERFDWRAAYDRFLDLAVRYFTYRIVLPRVLLLLLGRTQSHIEERNAEAIREEAAEREERERLLLCSIPPEKEGATPIHPKVSMREELSTTLLCELVTDLMTVIHATLVITRMTIDDPSDHTSASSIQTLDAFIVLLEAIFLVELGVRVVICRRKFFNAPLQAFDALTITLMTITQICMWAGWYRPATYDVLSALRMTRLFRLYHRVTSFTLLLEVVQKIGPPLAALLGILFLLLYSFAIVGIAAFYGELRPSNVNPASDYAQADYFPLHFDDLARALITLFWQLCTNNWYVLMDVLYLKMGFGVRLYFVSFYCLSVLIVFNVCTALVVEAYVELHEEKEERRLLGKKRTKKLNDDGEERSKKENTNAAAASGTLTPPTLLATPASTIYIAPPSEGGRAMSTSLFALPEAGHTSVHGVQLTDLTAGPSSVVDGAVELTMLPSRSHAGSSERSNQPTNSVTGTSMGPTTTASPSPSSENGQSAVRRVLSRRKQLTLLNEKQNGPRESIMFDRTLSGNLSEPSSSRVPRAGPKHLTSLIGHSTMRKSESPQMHAQQPPSGIHGHIASARRFATLQLPAQRAEVGLSAVELKQNGQSAFPNLVSKVMTMAASSSARRSDESSRTGSLRLLGSAAGALISSVARARTFSTAGDRQAGIAASPGALPPPHPAATGAPAVAPFAPASANQRRASQSFPASFAVSSACASIMPSTDGTPEKTTRNNENLEVDDHQQQQQQQSAPPSQENKPKEAAESDAAAPSIPSSKDKKKKVEDHAVVIDSLDDLM